jgi:hypothetical protein
MAALEEARLLAGPKGEVVLTSVLVVPVTQPLEASLEREVEKACGVLEEAEDATPGGFDTRLVRARSFAKGVLQTLAAEPFDLLVLESEPVVKNGAAAQLAALLEKAHVRVVVVRPAPDGAGPDPRA